MYSLVELDLQSNKMPTQGPVLVHYGALTGLWWDAMARYGNSRGQPRTAMSGMCFPSGNRNTVSIPIRSGDEMFLWRTRREQHANQQRERDKVGTSGEQLAT